jgi:carbamoyl-phosphate synthase small subunit
VVAYDYGVKHNILQEPRRARLQGDGASGTGHRGDALRLKPDGVFLSNGPGDPEPCDYAIKAIREIIGTGTPVFGICLGHQLLGLAAGAKTVKMKFGHHGANHPVQDLASGRVFITSQNHGFAVDEIDAALQRAAHAPLALRRPLQGIEYTDKPAYSFQGHPEASPGPREMSYLFDRFVSMMAKKKNA